MSSANDLKCQELVELITDYLEQRLDGSRTETFEQHVASCSGCTTQLRRARHTIDLLAALGNRVVRDEPAVIAGQPAASGSAERSYKFLRYGAVGPFTGTRWPLPRDGEPGGWVEAVGELRMCARGVHACRLEDLPHWISDELWMVELDGDVTRGERKVTARRGRLVRRVSQWNEEAAARFAATCAWRTRDRAVRMLRAYGHDGDADKLAACESLDEVVGLEQRLRPNQDPSWPAYLYAQTAAECSRHAQDAGATAAVAAAHDAGSAAAEEAERLTQAAELRTLLGLG